MKWTNDRIEEAKCLLKEGNTFKEIAEGMKLYVTPRAVNLKMNKLGLYASDYKERRVEDVICFECQIVFSAKKHEKRKFCSQHCSGRCNSRGVDRHKKSRGDKIKRIAPKSCLYCKVAFSNFTGKKYCSRNCQNEYQLEKRIASGSYSAIVAKKYLIKHKGNKCSICQLEPWQNETMPIELAYINGKSDDLSLTNLRLLCNSCNKKIPTYKRKRRYYRRSKIEVWLEEELTHAYPNLGIHFNKKDAIRSELDIYIPSLNKAVEVSGIHHYKPIFGQEKLIQIQDNDKKKAIACKELNIELLVLDISKITNFRPEKGKQPLNYIHRFITESNWCG